MIFPPSTDLIQFWTPYLQLNRIISFHITGIYIINELGTNVNYEKMDIGPGQERKYTIEFLSFMYAISFCYQQVSLKPSALAKMEWNGSNTIQHRTTWFYSQISTHNWNIRSFNNIITPPHDFLQVTPFIWPLNLPK